MKLNEMFSPLGSPKDNDQGIDWLGDLKFFIDNDNKMVEDYLFPAIRKHENYIGHPSAYKIYLRPLEKCLKRYCDKFKIKDPELKFPKEQLIELAKKIAKDQEEFLENGDYETE
jgi:hypothetical protein